jgi:hypothetical protein
MKDSIKEIFVEETKEVKGMIYRSPLPKKRQRVTHYKGRSGKVKHFTKDEIVQYLNNLQLKGA